LVSGRKKGGFVLSPKERRRGEPQRRQLRTAGTRWGLHSTRDSDSLKKEKSRKRRREGTGRERKTAGKGGREAFGAQTFHLLFKGECCFKKRALRREKRRGYTIPLLQKGEFPPRGKKTIKLIRGRRSPKERNSTRAAEFTGKKS